MGETYTTIKNILLDELLNTMRESFTRAEKYFDIKTIKDDKTEDNRSYFNSRIHDAGIYVYFFGDLGNRYRCII